MSGTEGWFYSKSQLLRSSDRHGVEKSFILTLTKIITPVLSNGLFQFSIGLNSTGSMIDQ